MSSLSIIVLFPACPGQGALTLEIIKENFHAALIESAGLSKPASPPESGSTVSVVSFRDGHCRKPIRAAHTTTASGISQHQRRSRNAQPLVAWIMLLIGAHYLRKSYNSIADHTKVDLFKTTGLVNLIGAATLIIVIGVFIIIIARILEIVSYFSLPENLPTAPEPPKPMTP